jgi:hypothetical protein
MTGDGPRVLRLEVATDSDEDRAALRGALLAARATELGEVRRRSGRLSYGYGTDSARDTMNDEVGQHQRRLTMLDRLLAALDDEHGGREP